VLRVRGAVRAVGAGSSLDFPAEASIAERPDNHAEEVYFLLRRACCCSQVIVASEIASGWRRPGRRLTAMSYLEDADGDGTAKS
jgi:hypothetical protein